MDVGFIGLGNMGAHMARRLVEAGHRVFVYDTRQEAIGNLAALGAVASRSPAEVADAAETVMVSLPTPEYRAASRDRPKRSHQRQTHPAFRRSFHHRRSDGRACQQAARGAQHRADR